MQHHSLQHTGELLQFHFTLKNILSFFLLVFFLHELHEMIHLLTIRAMCGCWSNRDFLIWELCGGCKMGSSYGLVVLAGTAVNYIALWIGYLFILKSKPTHVRSLGMALIFAALPLARIMAVASGGGDEVSSIKYFFQDHNISWYVLRILSFLIVLFLCGWPLYALFRSVVKRSRIFYFIFFLLVPLWIDRWIVSGFLNKVVIHWFPDQPRFMGAPPAVWGWAMLIFVLLIIYSRHLFTLATSGTLNIYHENQNSGLSEKR